MSLNKPDKPTDTNFNWEMHIYSQGEQLNRYPFDSVVSFIYRSFSRSKPRSETKILEIGCGAGNNLWFAAREGFSVSGIDGSSSAIEFALKRFSAEGLNGDLRVGDFNQPLPFESDVFDFVIDREALTCSGFTAARKTIAEVRRVLAPGGKFFFNCYSDRHSSAASGHPGEDGVIVDISQGSLVGIGPLNFYSKRQMLAMFQEGWQVQTLRHIEWTEMLNPAYDIHAEWLAIAQKI